MKYYILLITVLVSNAAYAQWSTNPTVNNPVCTAVNNQDSPQMISDGVGGAIMVWTDQRNGFTNPDIYAQRISAGGVILWTANGVAVSTATGQQENPSIVSDGEGGAIITWQDRRGGIIQADVYAQRIDAGGVVQWTANGVAVCTATSNQFYPTLVSDGSGGAIVTWWDMRTGLNSDLYAQRINTGGVGQWAVNGVPISTATGDQVGTSIVTDGSGGAILAWEDRRAITGYIYAQRITESGVVQWTENGVLMISTAVGNQSSPVTLTDGSGGAIIAWMDERNVASSRDIYAQRINAGGAVQWAANGEVVTTATGNQQVPAIVSDGSSGSIITWYDYRGGATTDIYAQRLNANGAGQWAVNGVAISTATGNQWNPEIAGDASGGAIITWYDYRSGIPDIYAQRVNSGGVVQWAANGVAVCTAIDYQDSPAIVGNGSGGAIIMWYDSRNGTDYDIYAQGIRADGSFGGTTSVLLSIKVFLEGAYDTGTGAMNTVLKTGGVLPLAQPYNVVPWNYAGTESVPSIPADVVDWVLVELRDAASPAGAILGVNMAGWPKAFFLKRDGSIVSLDGSSPPNIGTPLVSNSLFVVIRHRNHLAVLSSAGATLSGGTYSYDFTSGLAQANGGAAGYKMAGTKAVMAAGDIDHDDNIFVSDYNIWAIEFGATNGYNRSDVDMDRNAFVSDYNKWATNFGSTTSIGTGGITFTDSKPGHTYKYE